MAGILGSFFGGYESELLGRRSCLMIQNALVFFSVTLMSFSPTFVYLMIGRSVHGYSFGALTGAIPVYITEICQSKVRGKVGGAPGSMFLLTSVCVFILGAALPWRWLLLTCAVVPLMNFIALLFASETPTWYVIRGRPAEALTLLQKLRGNTQVAEQEYRRLVNNHHITFKENKVAKWRILIYIFKQPTFIRPLWDLIVVCVIGTHFAGMSALILYLNKIIIQAKVPYDPYRTSAIMMASTRGLMSLIAPLYLQYIPRKVMFTMGIALMGVGIFIVGVSLQYDLSEVMSIDHSIAVWMPIVGISLVYIGVSSGFLQTVMCFQGELLPSNGRAIGSGVLGIIDALVFFIVGKIWPFLNNAVGQGHALMICTLVVIGVVAYCWMYIPETMGKTLEDIEDYYRIKCYGDQSYTGTTKLDSFRGSQ